MTIAPPGLLAARRLLLDHLDMRPGPWPSDLDPAEVGIVGDPEHIGGYHCGVDRVVRINNVIVDYSVVESPRDRRGLSLYASAFDIGYFKAVTPNGTHSLYDFNAWLVGLCAAGDTDTLDIREVIYSLNAYDVRRWDRLGERNTGDASHRTHTHISEFRDARGRRMVWLMRRWLIHIALIKPPRPPTPQPSDQPPWLGFATGDDMGRPYALVKHTDHADVFGFFDSGIVRPISGPGELGLYTTGADPLPITETSSDVELARLQEAGRKWWST